MEKKGKKELLKFVYSIRITKTNKELLKNNDWIKKDLDKMVRDYFEIYCENKKK